MLKSDVDPLLDFLEENWPGKFTGEDAAVWAREFQAYELEEVRTACVTHKQNSRFRPYAREVREVLVKLYPIRRPPEKAKTNASRFVTVVAQQWAMTHPQLADDCEASLVMRYYRFWFCRVRKSITDVASARIGNGQQAMPDDAARIGIAKKQFTGNCLSDLLACGLTWEQADAASSWVDSTDLEFEQAIESLRSIPAGTTA